MCTVCQYVEVNTAKIGWRAKQLQAIMFHKLTEFMIRDEWLVLNHLDLSQDVLIYAGFKYTWWAVCL